MFAHEWTSHGLECRALQHPRLGHWCGYVGVPDSHPLHGREYYDDAPELAAISDGSASRLTMESVIDVHGGVTFSGKLRGVDGWWVGFDCAHHGDDGQWDWPDVERETEKMAAQVARVVG